MPTPKFICGAAYQALLDHRVFYTRQRGLPELRDALADYLSDLHAKPVSAERVAVMSSGMVGILLSLQALVGPGDELVAVTPVWPNIFQAARIRGADVTMVPLDPSAPGQGNSGWTLDLDRLFAAVTDRTRAQFLNSPGNPTGWVISSEDIARVLAFARERGLWIIADEVYNRMVYDGRAAPSFLDHAEPDDRLIVVNSFSKNWSMTGWRLGWVVAPTMLNPVWEKLVQFSTSGVPEVVQLAGLAALREGEPFVAEMVERCRVGRDIVCDALEGVPGIRMHRPQAAFYAFFAVDTDEPCLDLAKSLVDEAGVGLAPGSAFGTGGEGLLRLCFASSAETLRRAVDRLVPVLSR